MKSKRQEKIIELIKKNPVETQDELLESLSKGGFKVTQATISRDIKELGLIKYRNEKGIYCYTGNAVKSENSFVEKYIQIIKNNVNSIQVALNMIVIKCDNGMAQAVCASIDELDWNKNIIGTLAGDDTVFAVAKSERNAKFFEIDMKNIIDKVN